MSVRYYKGQEIEGSESSYVIEKDLSTGMFAVSYMAMDADGNKVFLKQYKSPSCLVDWYQGYMDYQQELKRRIHADEQLQSRTYGFLDFFERDRTFHQVFEFVSDGKDLREYLNEGRMSAQERVTFALLLLHTLSVFHNAGIVHTDLKPENLYLVPVDARLKFNLKLIDFDFTVLDGKKAPWHGKMSYCGTPRYMSPEHLEGKVPEKRSDVFTAALICYEILAQGHPYPEDDEGYTKAVREGNPPRPCFPTPTTPAMDVFGNLLMRALSPKAEDRPFADELHSALLAARRDFLNATWLPRPPVPPDPYKPKTAWVCPSCGTKNYDDSVSVCSCGSPRYAFYVLVGKNGRAENRLDSDFGRRNLGGLVGDESRFCERSQFRIFMKDGAWWIKRGCDEPPNPTVVDDAVLGDTPVMLKDGTKIAVTSRTKPDVRKCELTVALP